MLQMCAARTHVSCLALLVVRFSEPSTGLTLPTALLLSVGDPFVSRSLLMFHVLTAAAGSTDRCRPTASSLHRRRLVESPKSIVSPTPRANGYATRSSAPVLRPGPDDYVQPGTPKVPSLVAQSQTKESMDSTALPPAHHVAVDRCRRPQEAASSEDLRNGVVFPELRVCS